MTKPMPSRPQQFRTLLQRAAIELGLPRSHDTTQRLATVRLQRRGIREIQQLDLLSGKLRDPTKLLDADERLRLEEERLAPASSDHAVTVHIVPTTLCAKCRAEITTENRAPIVEIPVAVSDTADPDNAAGDGPTAKEPPPKPVPSNVVALDPLRSRDIHAGGYLKSDISRDSNMGGFTPKGQS
jgi:hypothetical protein